MSGRWLVAAMACVVVVAACAGAQDVSRSRMDLLPASPLVDTPPTVPERDLAAGQIAGDFGPVDGIPVGSAAAILSARVGDHLAGMAFPDDIRDPVMTFTIDPEHPEHPSVGGNSVDFAEDPLVAWATSGQAGDDSPSLGLVGGWAGPQVATAALQQDGRWIVAETVKVPGAGARAWMVAFDDVAPIDSPFERVAAYAADGQLLAGSNGGFDVLPAAAARLRGGGWQTADIGVLSWSDEGIPGLPHGPGEPIAQRTVTMASYGWVAQLARDEGRVYLGAGPTDRALAGDVVVDVAVDHTGLDADAVVAGAVEGDSDGGIVAGGYAAEQVDAVRIVFDDGAWLEVPTRVIAEPAPAPFRVWAVRATRPSAGASRAAAYYEAVDEDGGVIARVAVEPVS